MPTMRNNNGYVEKRSLRVEGSDRDLSKIIPTIQHSNLSASAPKIFLGQLAAYATLGVGMILILSNPAVVIIFNTGYLLTEGDKCIEPRLRSIVAR
jgi:hypothetical protein